MVLFERRESERNSRNGIATETQRHRDTEIRGKGSEGSRGNKSARVLVVILESWNVVIVLGGWIDEISGLRLSLPRSHGDTEAKKERKGSKGGGEVREAGS